MNHQLVALGSSSNVIYHGPDTVPHFSEFSIEKLIDKCQQTAPDVLELMRNLGTRESSHSADVDTEQVEGHIDGKLVMALCTLMKNRSKKVLGVQLLVSFMLVATSSSTQVTSNTL